MKNEIIPSLRNALIQNIDEVFKKEARHFFKEDIKLYGVRSPIVERLARDYFKQIKSRDKQEIFALCEELLQSDYFEEAVIAFNWSYWLNDRYDAEDFQRFERWVMTYANNWAKCDTLCNHTIGAFIEQFPATIENLKDWAKSGNRWVRRASAVTLILPARKGKFLQDVFAIADRLLMDQDDLVQKGYGWMLKEASRLHQREVFEYVMKHKSVMPRTALRYAIEKMPPELKKRAMEK